MRVQIHACRKCRASHSLFSTLNILLVLEIIIKMEMRTSIGRVFLSIESRIYLQSRVKLLVSKDLTLSWLLFVPRRAVRFLRATSKRRDARHDRIGVHPMRSIPWSGVTLRRGTRARPRFALRNSRAAGPASFARIFRPIIYRRERGAGIAVLPGAPPHELLRSRRGDSVIIIYDNRRHVVR